jgi:hypothetical protein
MTDNFKKVLYLGSCNHIEVVNYFPKCNEFVLIDTKPRSEHDEKYYFYEGFYREHFLKRVIKKCKKYGFILDKTIELDSNYINNINNIESNNINLKDIPYINPHLLIFNSKNNRIIKYYISTNILFNMTPILEDDIKTSNTLYVAGYHPDVELLKYINKKINFVGDNKTIYFYEPAEDENNIISNIINNNLELNDYFDNYYLVWREKSIVIVCYSLEDIDNKKKLINKQKGF